MQLFMQDLVPPSHFVEPFNFQGNVSNISFPTSDPQFLKMESPTLYILSVLHFIKFYCSPFVVVIGVVGNITTFMVIGHSRMRSTSLSIYFKTICIMDSLFLMTVSLVWLQYFDIYIVRYGGWCHGVTFLFNLSVFSALWLHVGLGMDRLFSVSHSCQKQRGSNVTKQSGKAVCFSIMILGIAVYVNISLQYGVILAGDMSMCMPLPDNVSSMEVLDTIDIIVNMFIGYISVIVIIIVLIIKLRIIARNKLVVIQTRLRVNFMTNIPLHLTRDNIAFTRSSVIVLVAFFIITLPSHIYRLCMLISDLSFPPPVMITLFAYQQFTEFLFLLRFASTFWILFFTSSCFRRSLRRLLSTPCTHVLNQIKHNRNHEMSNITLVPSETVEGETTANLTTSL